MNNKSDFTEILEEEIVDLKGIKVKVSLVKTKTMQGRTLIRTYSNFLRNDNNQQELKSLKELYALPQDGGKNG